MGNRMLARLAGAAAGGLLALAAAAPAMAADPVEIPLKESHAGHSAESGGWPNKCAAGEFNGVEVPEGFDGWHFVVPSAGGYKDVAFVSLTLTFDGGAVTIDDFDPSDGAWIRESNPRHAYLVTPAGWVLEGGVAEIVDGDPEGQFNVSHTCPGQPNDGDDGPGSGGEQPGNGDDEEPGNEDDEPGQADEEPSDEDQVALPVTGSAASRLVGVGALLLTVGAAMAGGVGLVALRRRRHLSNLADD